MSDRGDALLSALTTEHFVMQGAISSSVSEQQARASMYLYSVSGALVAIGFMAKSDHLLLVVSAILIVLFLTGLLTTLRLVDISMESLQSHVTVARIRKHYRSLGEAAELLFDPAHGRWPEGRSDSGQVTGPFLGLMTTAASMISCVNAMIGAALLVLVLANFAHLALPAAILVGVVFGGAQVVGFYFYQRWRIVRIAKLATDAGLEVGDNSGPKSR